jgi:hypothetical protein
MALLAGSPSLFRGSVVAICLALASGVSTDARAQSHQHTGVQASDTAGEAAPGDLNWRGVRAQLGLMAIGAATRVSPAYAGRDFTEGYLTQPALMSNLSWRNVAFVGTVNAEAWTLDRGELTPGIYGEGYVDRRHPHTVLHEAMASFTVPLIRATTQTGDLNAHGLSLSLSAGKGFAPFGTDDPMMRPFLKYPVNHHHAQILERAQIVGALRYSRGDRDVSIEAGVFNGDEPTGPFAQPQLSRLTDSRAIRITLRPQNGLEIQGSRAYVTSPDITQGGAADHAMLSASVRWQGNITSGISGYALAEIERNDEKIPLNDGFRYESALAEVMASTNGLSIAARFERTDRPEHERLLNPFRTPIGHIGFQLLGITRWATTTVQLSSRALAMPGTDGAVRLAPFAEVARAVPSAVVRPTVFEPELFYGARALWTTSLGVRLHVGTMRSRMGRYGVAVPSAVTGRHAMHH